MVHCFEQQHAVSGGSLAREGNSLINNRSVKSRRSMCLSHSNPQVISHAHLICSILLIRIGLQLFFTLELCENLHRGRTFPKQSRARKMGSFVSCNVNFEHAFKSICDDDDQNYPNSFDRWVRPFKMRPLALSFFLTLFEKCAFARKQPIVRDGPHSKLFTPTRARTSHWLLCAAHQHSIPNLPWGFNTHTQTICRQIHAQIGHLKN